MYKFNGYLSSLLVIVGSFTQCQNSPPYEYELANAADRCGGTAATLQDLLITNQEALDTLNLHLQKLPTGAHKKKLRLTYQRSLREQFALQVAADSLAAYQMNCSDWQKKKVDYKATILLHALIELNGNIEDGENQIATTRF